MSEFIGSRISLVSKSDIRYVGTLHEINSEDSTVALENVSSFGTEGRRNNAEDEIPPSDNVYEYIVFRGSDVKDLRIEEAPAIKENKPPQVPDDPAILGSGSRPPKAQTPLAATQNQQQRGPPSQGPPGPSSPGQGPPGQGPPGPGQFPQHSPYPPHFYPPPPGQWGRGGPPPGPGYPGMPYGAPPPGWYPPPGQGFPPGGQFPYGGFPPGPPGQFPPGPPGPGGQQGPQQPQQKPAPIGPAGTKQQAGPVEKSVEPSNGSKNTVSAPTNGPTKAPTPTEKSKAGSKDTASSQPASFAAAAATKSAPSAPRNGRIIPAIPLQSPGVTKAPLQGKPVSSQKVATGPSNPAANNAAVEDATKAATAAVAAAMAKLPPAGGQPPNGSSAVDNLTRKVNEMRTTENTRAPRLPGVGSGFRGERNDRGRGRGGRAQETHKVDVPSTDFDFESSNAKFNKQDLVKEAIAGSPLGENPPASDTAEEVDHESTVPAAPSYNKKSSFFDDLSSDNKDRAEGAGNRPGGREWRGEEQKKNLETFGQGSVDNGYRGGFRGRGRGRGQFRGRGYGGNGQPGGARGGGRGGFRGGRGDFGIAGQ